MQRRIIVSVTLLLMCSLIGRTRAGETGYPRPRVQAAPLMPAHAVGQEPLAGVDFVYSRLCNLAAQRPWSNTSGTSIIHMPSGVTIPTLFGQTVTSQASGSQFAAERPEPAPAVVAVQYVPPPPMPTDGAPVIVDSPPPMMGPTEVMVSGEGLPCGVQEDRSRWVAAGGLYCLRPYWRSNPALRIQLTETSGAVVVADATQTLDFDDDYQLAPRVWLGYVTGEGFGVRGRFWSFDESSATRLTNPAGSVGSTNLVIKSAGLDDNFLQATAVDDVLTASHDLQVHVWDLEATQEALYYQWVILLSGGVRYGSFDETYSAALLPAGAVASTTAEERRAEFQGIGPVVAYEIRRGLGSEIGLYHSARGTVLLGSQDDTFAIVSSINPGRPLASDQSTGQRFVPMGEFELGGDWQTQMDSLQVTVRATLVGIVRSDFALGGASVVLVLQR